MTTRSSQQVGRGCGTVFFGMFASIGLLVTVFLAMAVWQNVRTKFWDPTPCTILTSEMELKHGKYHLNVSYHYVYKGQEYTGSRLTGSNEGFDDSGDAQRATRRFRGDQRSTCFVNPAAPEESVLQPGSPWALLLILFPLIFVAIGVIGLIAMRQAKPGSKRAISDRHVNSKSAGTLLRIVGIFFILVGSIATYFLSIRPWLAIRESQNWKEVPCTILSSHVASHSSSEGGTTYSIDIRYQYSWDGETLLGDRYNFDIGSSSGRDWRQQVVKQYPPGRKTVCYVDPKDPVDPVLVRDSSMGWWGLIPAVFILAGMAMVYGARKSKTAPALTFSSPRDQNIGNLRGSISAAKEPITLRSASTPVAGFVFTLIFALIWNGIVWGILTSSTVATAAKFFLAIFALIGAAIFAAAVHQFLAMFNPRPTLQLSNDTVRLGDTLQLQFHFTGRVQRIQRLKLSLQGKEVATYRRGTDTVTDKNVFADATLFDTADRAQMPKGTVIVQIPHDTMHSMEAPNNKIVWSLRLHGQIPRWPDVDQEFPLSVLPHPIPARQPTPE